ncbi:MAG: ABC transporter substrate-binding protein, partial [Candidatus Tumulicola sp.]
GFHKLAVRRGITRPADLAGKRIGSVRATAQSYVTTEYLAHHGIAPDAVTIVSLQDLFDEVAALRAGRIDAGFVWANGVAQAKLVPGVHILENDTSAGVHFFGYLVTSERYARGHRADIVRVLRAFADAGNFMEAHPLEAAQIAARHSGVDVTTMDALLSSQHYTVDLQPDNPRSFVAMAAFATRNDPIRTWPDPASSFDDSYLREALPARDGLHR